MGVDNHMDILPTKTQSLQGVQQRRGPFYGKHALKLFVLLGAQPCVHQDVLPMGPDQQTGEAQRDAVHVLGFTALLPEDFRYDTEHGSAIKPKPAVAHGINLKCSELHLSTNVNCLELLVLERDRSLRRMASFFTIRPVPYMFQTLP